jgi:hypothetical protein
MRRISIVAVLGLSVLAVAGQFVAPRIAAHEVESRLTKSGGSADAQVSSFPWPRLLFKDGDRIRVRARGIELPLVSPTSKVLDGLDGFDDVDIEVTDASAAPFRLQRVTLRRNGGDHPYLTGIQGTITARDLATFSGAQAGGALGGFLTGLAGGALPFGDQPIPIDIQTTLRSDGGRPRAVVVHGTVAGLPAGALAEALAQALAGRF